MLILAKFLSHVCLSVEGIIITICCPWFQSEKDKSLVRSTIKKAFNDNRKVYIAWFENGNLVENPGDLINFLTSYPSPQQPFPYSWNYKIYLPSGKTVLVLTRIRKGIISDQTNRPEDVQYWKPGFVVPCEIKDDLFKKNSKTLDGEIFILMTEKGQLACQVNKKDGHAWQNFILLGLDETVVLQTQLRYGTISFEAKDLVIVKENLRVPQDEVTRLKKNFQETPSADLYMATDQKGNSRFIVKVGTSSQVFTVINTVFNQAAGKKLNPLYQLVK